ncbi:pertactin-like passenger domain-containing protein, partial [uncultured Desulfovibrio sp.]|uniref:pertactin-like passenger domain-containing protein n=1 Tax=uncultured Desulfovibrio sp. TaxID=167968 RepID=UPI0028046AC6
LILTFHCTHGVLPKTPYPSSIAAPAKKEERNMPHPAKETRHRSTRTAKSMARLALGPLILTGLFLAGSLCTVSARAETIDLASQPGFHTAYRDWIEDGSTLRLKTDFVSGRTDQVIINYWQDWEGQFRIHVTPTGAESGIPETDFLAHLHEGAQVNCSLTNPGGKVDMGVYVYELARRELPIPVEEAFYAAPDTEGAFMSLGLPSLP